MSWRRAKHSAALGASGQRWAEIGDRGGRRNSFKLFSSPPVSMVYCRTTRAWLLLCSSPCASWSTMLQCVPSWHNRATLLLIVSPAISGRILVHHNYWGGPQFPHILTSLWWRWGYSQKGTILYCVSLWLWTTLRLVQHSPVSKNRAKVWYYKNYTAGNRPHPPSSLSLCFKRRLHLSLRLIWPAESGEALFLISRQESRGPCGGMR